MNSSSDYAASDEGLSEPLALSALCFTAMGILCCVQVFLLTGITFRRRSGLYFWCLIGAATAQLVVCLSLLIKNWILKDRLIGVSTAMSTLGYLFFPPFQFLILYSRLHLLQASRRTLKFVLTITVLEWLLAELPMAIVGVLIVIHPDSAKITRANNFWWEFEEALYPTVEFIMCFLYILQVKRMWGHSEGKTKWVLWHVIIMSTIVILVDISYLILTNLTNWDWADALEAFLFALKLQVEIYALSMLTKISTANLTDAHQRFGVEGTEETHESSQPDFVTSALEKEE